VTDSPLLPLNEPRTVLTVCGFLATPIKVDAIATVFNAYAETIKPVRAGTAQRRTQLLPRDEYVTHAERRLNLKNTPA
jgi:hypothetical protein